MVSFLLEVGTEELPATFVETAIQQWKQKIPASLKEQFLSFESVHIWGTPRRLAVLIEGLPSHQPDREEEIKGPPASTAFKDGKPTPAAEGFIKKQGVTLEDLEIRPTSKGDFVFVLKKIPGRLTAEILAELTSEWITKLEGKRFMRWAYKELKELREELREEFREEFRELVFPSFPNDGGLKFPRPIRWLITLLDDQVLPVALMTGFTKECEEHMIKTISDNRIQAKGMIKIPVDFLKKLADELSAGRLPKELTGIESNRISRGHRVLHPEPITISDAKSYVESLRKGFIEVDPQVRIQRIQQEAKTAANSVGGQAEIPEDLLAEVVNLVEWPTAVVGTFDQEFLNLPAEVIKTVMVTHQRYFPVLTTETQNSSSLKPYFITISNGDPAKSDLIAAGNERVIRARLADAKFFYESDLKTPLESYLPALEAVTFQEDLGSVRDKVNRIGKIANWIADQLNVSESDRNLIQRAALLCKADLVTQMVYEFPELQGVMGEKYASEGGEPEAVATAIFEHYLPRSATDNLPQTLVGQVVGLADKLDTLVSIFGLGMLPTGSSDPFALRRAANAVINIIWVADLPLNLYQLLKQISADFVNTFPNAMLGLTHQLDDFFLQRIKTLLQDEKAIDYDLVNAVLGDNDLEYKERALQDLLDVRDRALFLQTIRNDGTLDQIYETVNRSTRLAKQGDLNTLELQPDKKVKPDLFQKSSEQEFYQALVQLVPKTQASQTTRNYRQLVEALAEITPTVSSFFDGPESVLVMDDDPNIQRNRLNLLGLLRNHSRVLADFGAIVKS